MEEQIIGILRGEEEASRQWRGVSPTNEAGGTFKEITRRHRISEQSFYRWNAKYGGLARITALAYERRRFGYRRIHALLRREGWRASHKAVHRNYVEEELRVRKRKRTKREALGV